MKTCPNCKMTTDSHSECAVCGHSLVDIEYSERKGEKYVLNKYFLPFLWKHHKTPLICLIIVLIGVVFCVPYVILNCLGAVVCSAYALYLSLYKNKETSQLKWKYDDLYLESRHKPMVYLLSAMSILLQAVAVFISINERMM